MKEREIKLIFALSQYVTEYLLMSYLESNLRKLREDEGLKSYLKEEVFNIVNKEHKKDSWRFRYQKLFSNKPYLPSNEIDSDISGRESGLIGIGNDSQALKMGILYDGQVWKLPLNYRKQIFDAYLGGPYTSQEEFCVFCCERLVNYYILTNDDEKLIIWKDEDDWGNWWCVARFWENELQQYIGNMGGICCYADGWEYHPDDLNNTGLKISLDDQGMIDLDQIGLCLEKALLSEGIHRLSFKKNY